jgi:hypothetical protein
MKALSDFKKFGYERGLCGVVCDKTIAERNKILQKAGNELLKNYISEEKEEAINSYIKGMISNGASEKAINDYIKYETTNLHNSKVIPAESVGSTDGYLIPRKKAS